MTAELSPWAGGILPEEQWGSRECSSASSSSLVAPVGRMSARSLRARLEQGDRAEVPRDRAEVPRNTSLQQRESREVDPPLGSSRQLKTIGVLHCMSEPSTLLTIARGGTDRRSCGSLATRRQFRSAAIGLGLSRPDAQLYPNEIKAAQQDRGPLHLFNLCAPGMNKCDCPTMLKWLLILIFLLFESSISVLIFFSKDGLRSTVVGPKCLDEADEDECVAYRCAGMCEIKTILDLCPRTCMDCMAECKGEDTWVSSTGLSCNTTASSPCDFETTHGCSITTLVPGDVAGEYVSAEGVYSYDSCSGCGHCSPDISNQGDYPFNIMEFVLMVEVGKFVFFGLILLSKGICRRPKKLWDLRIFAVLAPFDVCTFWLQFLSLKYLTPSQFAVLFNVDTVLTAVFFRLVIQLKVMRLQYLGLIVIFTGCAQLVVWEEFYLNNEGVLFVFLSAFVSSAWNFIAESCIGSKSMYESKLGALQNMFLSTFFSAAFSGLVVLATIPNVFAGNSLIGLTPGWWVLSIVLVCYEICLLIIRDMLNLFIVAVISALAIPLTFVLDYTLFLGENRLGIATCFSAIVVTLGVLMFNGNHLGFAQHLRQDHIELLFPTEPEPVRKKKHRNSKSRSSSSRKKKRKRNSRKKSENNSSSLYSRGQLAKSARQSGSSGYRSKRTGSSSPSLWVGPTEVHSRIRPEVSSPDTEMFSSNNLHSLRESQRSKGGLISSPNTFHSRKESQRSQGGLMPEYFS